MTHRERFIRTLKCELVAGQVPTFELVFFLTMEALGKVHPQHRSYHQWSQMSRKEQKRHIDDVAQVHIDIARKYGHSAIFFQSAPGGFEGHVQALERIRELTGDEYFIINYSDPTWPMPDGDHMMDFSAMMYEEPEKLCDETKRRMEYDFEIARKLKERGPLVDGFAMCSDYCFNVNPFFTPELFDQLIVPFLKETIDVYRQMGYYTIKHTDGNIIPIVKQIADCKPDAIHSLDPQGGVSIPEVRKIIGDDICLIGNVNCGLLQTGSEQECREDVLRSLRQGMERGFGYIFSTSNCAYTGLPLERYELMNDLWRKYGNYEDYHKNFPG